jgi:zinc D-Ala-D-Ala carboxypeptidase
MILKPFFDLDQFAYSETAVRRGINNKPNDQIVIGNLIRLYDNILSPLAKKIDKPIFLSSGYRSPQLNKAIGGSPTSQHMQGQAADIVILGMDVEWLYQSIKNSGLPFDQLIQEFNRWVHVSYSPTPRKQCLRATKKDKKTIYTIDANRV